MYKFERLKVWQLSMDYSDLVYELLGKLPREERYNLADQLRRACTSVSLNIAEGSTMASNKQQAQYLGIALRSFVETMACFRLMERRGYVDRESELGIQIETKGDELYKKLIAFRKSLY